MAKPQKSAVITGVSSGIGRACAQALMNDGWRVYGSVRKQADAETVIEALGENFTPLIFDVTDRASIEKAAAHVASELGNEKLAGLINNAGIAVSGPVAHLPEDDLRYQFDVNVYGPLRVTQAFLPLLGMDKSRQGAPGRIVNMSSVAGKISSPFMSPYAMSKHALEAMSHSLRRELMPYGIDVVIVAPGAVKTPIWAKADEMNIDQYKDTDYFDILSNMKKTMHDFGQEGLEPNDVGAIALKALTKSVPKTRYALLKNKITNWTIPRLLPTRTLDKAIAKRFGITRENP